MQYSSFHHQTTFTTRHIQNWVLFLLWLSVFIFSGAVSPLLPRSMLDTNRPGGFIFQCHIFLLFHTVYGVLRPRMLKWCVISFSSRPDDVLSSLCTITHLYWVALHGMAHSFIELGSAMIYVIILISHFL